MDIIAMATKILLQKTQRCKINFRMKLKGNTFLPSLLFRIFARPLAIAFLAITYLTNFSTLIHILFMHFWRYFLSWHGLLVPLISASFHL
jgi:hypothetical protein